MAISPLSRRESDRMNTLNPITGFIFYGESEKADVLQYIATGLVSIMSGALGFVFEKSGSVDT